MSEKMTTVDGDIQKKRVASTHRARLMHRTMLNRCQCYFFDSDIGGFHYGPGHPYVLQEFLSSKLNGLHTFTQNETNPDTYVPLVGHELRAVQEDGDIRTYHTLIPMFIY